MEPAMNTYLDKLMDDMLNIEFKSSVSLVKSLKQYEDTMNDCYAKLMAQLAMSETANCKCVRCLESVSAETNSNRQMIDTLMRSRAVFVLELASNVDERIEGIIERSELQLGLSYYSVRMSPNVKDEWLNLKMQTSNLTSRMRDFCRYYTPD